MTEWGHAHTKFCSSLHKLVGVCVYWQRQTAMLPSAAPPTKEEAGEEKKKRTRLSILFIATLQDTERLSLHSAGAGKIWKWLFSERVFVVMTACKTDLDAHSVVSTSVCVCVSVCRLWRCCFICM